MTEKRKVETKSVSKTKKTKVNSKKVALVKKETKKKVVKKPRAKSISNLVTLPKNMSKKSILKAESLHEELDKYIKYSVLKVTYISAFCFIVVGTFLSFASFSLNNKIITKYQTAQVVSTNLFDTGTSDTDFVSYNEPKFTFLNEIPDELTEDYSINFRLENATVRKVILIRTDYAESVKLNFEENGEDYTVTIPTDINSGYYELRVGVESLDGFNVRTYSSNLFHILNEKEEFEVENNTTTVDIDGGTVDIIDEIVDLQEDTEQTDLIESVEDFSIEPPDNVDIETISPEVPELDFYLTPEDGNVLSDVSVLHADISAKIDFIELYARSLNSLTENFIALGVKNSKVWKFVFNTNNLKNGNYEFYAKTVLNGNSIKSGSKIITIYNVEERSSSLSSVETIENNDDADDGIEQEEITREFFQPNEVILPSSSQESTISPKVQKEVEKLLETNNQEMERLLKNYAVSLQSEDSILTESVKQQLSELQKTISVQSLANQETRYYSDDIEELLKNRFNETQERIVVFEDLRKDHSSGDTAKDSDLDGISDFDEISLYKTDPAKSDTDNDGVLDGVEIISGYNPLDKGVEAIIDFESPKNTVGLERADVLVIEDVTPVINVYNRDTGDETVRTDIRGKALPNSYVTLYIFSSPTIVTIKTDSDGSFEYTFDKELEDGRHDVYIAVTDNAGSIVAQSSPFSFVKQAQAFTPVDVSKSEIVTQNTIIETAENSYATVFGIAIISLGVILLMLGIGLRTRNEEEFILAEILKDKKESVV